MEIKILQVFYDKNGLPYKDKERTVHYPITSGTFLGASNTTQIRFYYDQLDKLNESTFVAVSKLPNGRIGSEILESGYDSELQERYAVLNLSQFYTQYKGDVYISLQGYQGGVRVEQDENGIYQIYGTPTIQATGSIKLSIAYAPTFIGSGETENVNFQRVLAELSTKLGIRQETLHVEELPAVGNPNVWYVINDDPDDTTKANIYIWNANTQTYVWVGDNILDLGDYYTQEQGEQFEQDVRETIGNGSPKGVYANLSDLESAYPTGTNGIYVVSADGHWYFWNGSAWTDGGVYMSSVSNDDVLYIKNSFGGLDYFVNSGEQNGYYDISGVFHSNSSYTCSKFPSYNIFEINFTNIADVLAEVILFDKNDDVISYHGTSIGSYSVKIPNNCYYIAINFFGSQYTDGFTIRSFKSADRDKIEYYLGILTNGKARIIFYKDASIYRKAEVNVGSKIADEESITFTYPGSSTFNGIIFSNNTTVLNINNNLERTFTFEFDVVKTSSVIRFKVDDNNNATLINKYLESGHNKITFDLKDTTTSIKYVYFVDGSTDGVPKTLEISNLIIYQGDEELNLDIYNLIYQAAHQDSGKVKILNYKDASVYVNSLVLNGSKTNTTNSVTFTYTPTNNFNGIIYSSGTTPIVISNDFTKKLYLEFDATFDGSVVLKLVDNNGNSVYTTIVSGHNKVIYNESDITNGIKYLHFADQSGSSSEKTLLIENIVLYQGDDIDPYPYELIYELAKSSPAMPFEGKKILTIGDSLTNAAGDGLHWQTFVVEKLKLAGYLTAGGSGYTIANRTENSIYSHVMSLTVDNDVEIITLWGGTNDWGESVPLGDFDTQKVASTRDNTTFYGGLFDCVEKLLTLYPTKSLMIVGTTQRITDYAQGRTSNESVNSQGLKLPAYVDAVKKVAEFYSLPFMDLYHSSNINKYSMTTYMFEQTSGGVSYYLHFSGTGQRHIAKKFIEFIKRHFE